MKSKILHYLAAMNASAFDAAVHAVVVYCGMAGLSNALPESVKPINLRQLIGVFAVSFGLALAKYISAHPVQELVADAEAAPQPNPAPPQSGGAQ